MKNLCGVNQKHQPTQWIISFFSFPMKSKYIPSLFSSSANQICSSFYFFVFLLLCRVNITFSTCFLFSIFCFSSPPDYKVHAWARIAKCTWSGYHRYDVCHLRPPPYLGKATCWLARWWWTLYSPAHLINRPPPASRAQTCQTCTSCTFSEVTKTQICDQIQICARH